MHSNLSDLQLKTNSHIYVCVCVSIYMNLEVTKNQKPTTDTQKNKKKIIKSQGKRLKEEKWTKEVPKTAGKQLNGSRYIHINNNFKCKWTKYFNQKEEGLNGLKKKKTHLYAAYKRITSYLKMYIDGKDTPVVSTVARW